MILLLQTPTRGQDLSEVLFPGRRAWRSRKATRIRVVKKLRKWLLRLRRIIPA